MKRGDELELISCSAPCRLEIVDIFVEDSTPQEILTNVNKSMRLSLDNSEIDYLVNMYKDLGRSPTDVELYMFSQINSGKSLGIYYTRMDPD